MLIFTPAGDRDDVSELPVADIGPGWTACILVSAAFDLRILGSLSRQLLVPV